MVACKDMETGDELNPGDLIALRVHGDYDHGGYKNVSWIMTARPPIVKNRKIIRTAQGSEVALLVYVSKLPDEYTTGLIVDIEGNVGWVYLDNWEEVE